MKLTMVGSDRPLLLDVDGVLIPYAAPVCPPGFLSYWLQGEGLHDIFAPLHLCTFALNLNSYFASTI
jgi:hypothetical protein